MEDLTEVILVHLEKAGHLNSLEFANKLNVDHQKVFGALKSLQCLGDVIRSEQISSKQWELTEEGHEVVENGSHEAIVFSAVPKEGISMLDLKKSIPNANIGFSKAMSLGWVTMDKSASDGRNIKKKVESIQDVVRENLLKIKTNEDLNSIADSLKQEYKKRKLLQEVVIKSLDVTKGNDFSTSVSKLETDLTPEMISSGSWKEKKFKPYNFDALGVPPTRGHLHPLMRMRAQFRQIFLEMGFSEMPTNNFIESSFWNFDALFVPQKHPARDSQDTFFVSEPKCSDRFPEDYLQRVSKVHQDGDYGSQGYKYEWKLDEARKNVLRTHTTAVSARMLHRLAQQKFTPVKYFSIDRVFRNETLDATHLAEFFQIEGVIADYGLSLGDLIGVLYEFFKKLGITKLRFKPAYNPYTEPSMEIFSYHEGLKKWVEVGNSGLFRPEMLLPMGLPKEVTVIAWGLSLERPTMIKFGIDNIRDLEGHKVNLQMVYDAPICRLDKNEQEDCGPMHQLEIRQEHVLQQLRTVQKALEALTANLKMDLNVMSAESAQENVSLKLTECIFKNDVLDRKDIAIHVSMKQFPLSVLVLCRQLGRQRPLIISSHFHSSLKGSISENIKRFMNGSSRIELAPCNRNLSVEPIKITFVWYNSTRETAMMVNPIYQGKIEGEVNVIRYLGRHLDPPYDEKPITATSIDQWLDIAHNSLIHGNAKDVVSVTKLIEARLAKSKFLVGNKMSLADVVVCSILLKKAKTNFPLPVQNWVTNLSQHEDFDLAVKFVIANNA